MVNQNQEVLPLPGEATIRTIGEIKNRIEGFISQNETLALDLSGIQECDLTLVQAIEAARRGAEKQKKSLSLSGPATGPVRELLERGGFLTRPEAADFWLGGREPGDG